MAEKEEIAIKLLERGLTISQVAGQLRCSPFFVRKVRNERLAKMEGAQVSPAQALG
jgi:hypothetical protein